MPDPQNQNNPRQLDVNEIIKEIIGIEKFEVFNKIVKENFTRKNNDNPNDNVFCKTIDNLKKEKKNIDLYDLCYNENKCKHMIYFIKDIIKGNYKEIFKLFVLSYKPEALFRNKEDKLKYRDECIRLALGICDTLYSVSRLYNRRNNEQNKKYYFPCVPMLGDIIFLAYYLIYNGIDEVDVDKIEFTVKHDNSSDLEMRFSINSNLCQ